MLARAPWCNKLPVEPGRQRDASREEARRPFRLEHWNLPEVPGLMKITECLEVLQSLFVKHDCSGSLFGEL
jgi:hypothetical protein